jgi:hypothetical protein
VAGGLSFIGGELIDVMVIVLCVEDGEGLPRRRCLGKCHGGNKQKSERKLEKMFH